MTSLTTFDHTPQKCSITHHKKSISKSYLLNLKQPPNVISVFENAMSCLNKVRLLVGQGWVFR